MGGTMNYCLQRLLLAGLVASGMLAFGGAGLALAQSTTSIAAVPCTVTATSGALDNFEPNFSATANRAEFAFLSRVEAIGDEVTFYAPATGGEDEQGIAAIKAIVVREGDGPLSVETMQFHLPITAIRHEGQLYGIAQMSLDQGIPVGLELSSGGEAMGSIVFEAASFDPAQPVIGFDAATATLIHEMLMRAEGFSARLVAGGEAYSVMEPDTAAYASFIGDTLMAAMDEARRRDVEEVCTYLDEQDPLQGLSGLFPD